MPHKKIAAAASSIAKTMESQISTANSDLGDSMEVDCGNLPVAAQVNCFKQQATASLNAAKGMVHGKKSTETSESSNDSNDRLGEPATVDCSRLHTPASQTACYAQMARASLRDAQDIAHVEKPDDSDLGESGVDCNSLRNRAAKVACFTKMATKSLDRAQSITDGSIKSKHMVNAAESIESSAVQPPAAKPKKSEGKHRPVAAKKKTSKHTAHVPTGVNAKQTYSKLEVLLKADQGLVKKLKHAQSKKFSH